MQADQLKAKDKTTEAMLDCAESGSTKESGVSARSRAAAFRSLQLLFEKEPQLLFTKVWNVDYRKRTGICLQFLEAQAWSRIQSYPSPARTDGP